MNQTTETPQPTNAELVAQVVGAVTAVQDAEAVLVEGAKNLADHIADPNAHGTDVSTCITQGIADHDDNANAHDTLARKIIQITAGTGLSGGGTLEANRTLSVKYGTAAGTACQGNDSRLANTRTPTAHAFTSTTYGAASDTLYGHAKASGTTPKAAGTAAVGAEMDAFARGDHVHPAQTTVSGNAGTATKLATARTINGVGFDGSKDIAIGDSTKLPLSGGVMTGSIQNNDPANVISIAPSENIERGLFLGDRAGTIMGGFDVIQLASDNSKYTQLYSKNSRGDITSLAAVTYEDGIREILADSPIVLGDVQISRVLDSGNRVLVLSGARGTEGYSFRFSPDTGDVYMDGRAMHAKSDTAGHADSAGTATKLATARTVRTNLASTSTASFDGSANITPGVTGVLPVANGGTGNTTNTAADSTKWNGAAKTVSTGNPSGGANGDIWFKY